MPADYPVRVDFDDAAPQNRLTVLVRLLLVIPHGIIIGLLAIVAFIIYFISWFAIAFTGRYPEGMLRFVIGVMRWSVRVNGYFYLLTDRYPPFSLDEDAIYPVRVEIAEEVEGRNRLTTFWPIRWILSIPHMIILQVLGYVMNILVVIAWIIALITGSVPVGLHNFMAGYVRWQARAYAYYLNVTDKYPPFSLS